MAGSRNDSSLNSDQLAELLRKLEDVMTETKRLREQIARQLVDERRSQQQRLSPESRPTRKRR